MIKRIVSGILAGTMAVSLFAGCSGKKNVEVKDSKTQTTTQPGTDIQKAADDMSKKYEIKWAGWPNFANGEEGGYIEKLIEEKFNVEIKPVFMDSNGYKQKRPVMFASGDIPDVIYEADPVDLQRDAGQGFLIELPYDLITKNAPNFFKIINEYAPEAWIGTYYNGKNYGIPTTRALSNNSTAGAWRMDWLNNVGITKVPETLDEMHDAFVKFTNNDPDKNGKKDTYGMTGDVTSWNLSFTEIFGAYGNLPFSWMKKDGQVVWGGTLPETKEALKLLAQWYKEGLIHPDFVTDLATTDGPIEKKFINGQTGYFNHAGYSGTFNPNSASSILNKLKKVNPLGEIAASTPPKGPTGVQTRFKYGAAGNIYGFGKQLQGKPEVVARVLKIWDTMISDEKFYIESKSGKQGTHWEYVDSKIGPASGIKALAPYDDPNQAAKQALWFDVSYVSFFSPSGGDLNIINKYRSKEQVDLENKYMNPKYATTDIFLKPDVVPQASKYMNDLRNLQKTAFAEIIRGEKSIDNFDNFVKQWKTQGGEELTKEANNLGKISDEIYKKVGIKK